MDLNDINPYVRFARSKESRIPYGMTVALDHRIFYCLSDSATIEVGGKIYELKKDSVIFWKAGIPYRNLTKNSSVYATGFNFDLYAKQFDGYNWGGCDDINDILRRINLKPTGNKFNYKGIEYGSDSDHGHSYSWEFKYDEIWEVA